VVGRTPVGVPARAQEGRVARPEQGHSAKVRPGPARHAVTPGARSGVDAHA
jgi:hypothetical protein